MDTMIQKLLEQAIDTPAKLHLLLLFAENPRLEATPKQLAGRTCRDIWSVTQALQELAEDGVLVVQGSDLLYRYLPTNEWVDAIRRLVRTYDDPMERDRINSSIREIASFAMFTRQSSLQRQPLAF